MDIQSLIALVIVAIAAILAIRHLWRSISRANRKSDAPLYCEGCALKEQCKKRGKSTNC